MLGPFAWEEHAGGSQAPNPLQHARKQNKLQVQRMRAQAWTG